jgi:ABC-2 type transport system ATP-binding protein
MSLEIRNITKYYGRQKALDNVSFNLRKGELVGFLGPNGAGKTTLMRIITGYIPADQGEIWVNGTKVTVESIQIKREIGYLPENNPLYNDLFVKEYLEVAAGFYKLVESRKRVEEMLSLTGLKKEQHKKIGALSKGYKQRVGLAQALLHDPAVLILDEPTNGLDPNQLGEIRSLITDISKEKTVLLSSHILQEIEAICERVVIINNGKLVADSNIKQLKDEGFKQNQQVYAEFEPAVSYPELISVGGLREIHQEGHGWLVTAEAGTDVRPLLFRFAVSSGITLLSLTERQQNLESIFRILTTE